MGREWEPGDVALVKWSHRPEGAVCIRATMATVGDVWWGSDGWIGDSTAKSARPLVVIDPEDREQVERFREIASRWADQVPYSDMREPGDMDHTEAMQAALREFATPTPPKPEEPTGLGAVVEDDEGRHWVRTHGVAGCLWHDGAAATARVAYSRINAVRILSPGWSE